MKTAQRISYIVGAALVALWCLVVLAVDVDLGRFDQFTFVGDGTNMVGSCVPPAGYETGEVRAVAFDGQNYAASSETDLLLSVSALTVECFIFVDSEAENVHGGILGAYNNTDGEHGWQVRFDEIEEYDEEGMTNVIYRALHADWGYKDGAWAGGNADTPLPLDLWVHVALTWDGANVYLFQDGALVGTWEADSLDVLAVPVRLGVDPAEVGAEVQVKTATVSQECKWTSGFSPPSTLATNANTLAFWPFNETGGNVLYDVVSGVNATFYGDPLPQWVPQ